MPVYLLFSDGVGKIVIIFSKVWNFLLLFFQTLEKVNIEVDFVVTKSSNARLIFNPIEGDTT